MKKLCLLGLFGFAVNTMAMEGKTITVYKSPYCGCCTMWSKIMENKGFKVKTILTEDVAKIKQKAGLTPELASCHTAFVDDYVLEGHVSYSAIQRLLTEKPDIKGLAVPGMPAGSTGMEQGNITEKYDILSIHKDSSTRIFEAH